MFLLYLSCNFFYSLTTMLVLFICLSVPWLSCKLFTGRDHAVCMIVFHGLHRNWYIVDNKYLWNQPKEISGTEPELVQNTDPVSFLVEAGRVGGRRWESSYTRSVLWPRESSVLHSGERTGFNSWQWRKRIWIGINWSNFWVLSVEGT